jgi:hypothetical protein
MERIILSYPRSGSNFLNDCLNKMTGRGFSKTHAHYHRFWQENTQGKDGKVVVLMLRNYKECIPRHTGERTPEGIVKHATGLKATELPNPKSDKNGKRTRSDYMALIRWYDSYQGKKTVVYYEDFVNRTAEELKRLADFLGDVTPDMVNEFISSLDKQRKASANKYNKSFGKTQSLDASGNPVSTKFHSNSMSKQHRISTDNNIKQKFPTLYEKYLKRYEEA